MKKDFTCFLIEDDADDQELFLTAMESVAPRVQCFTAINGKDAIIKLNASEVKPDLIFLDLNMPVMDGKEFLRSCGRLQTCKDIPVIILTTSSDQPSMEETRQLGAKDFITKPSRYSLWGKILGEKLREFQN
jgi:CheY-like chemotaxis protein